MISTSKGPCQYVNNMEEGGRGPADVVKCCEFRGGGRSCVKNNQQQGEGGRGAPPITTTTTTRYDSGWTWGRLALQTTLAGRTLSDKGHLHEHESQSVTYHHQFRSRSNIRFRRLIWERNWQRRTSKRVISVLSSLFLSCWRAEGVL